MRTTALLCALGQLLSTWSALAQGYFHFSNFELVPRIDARIFDGSGVPLDTNYQALLYVGPTLDSLRPVFLAGRSDEVALGKFNPAWPGYLVGQNTRADNVAEEALAWVELRAWDTRLGATFEEAQQMAKGGFGSSDPFQVRAGRVTGAGISPAYLTGLKSFSLAPIAEPAASLLLFLPIACFSLQSKRCRRFVVHIKTFIPAASVRAFNR